MKLLVFCSFLVSLPLYATDKVCEPEVENKNKIHLQGVIGTDDRVPSFDPKVGRTFPQSCTAWLIAPGLVLTAGHCVDSEKNRQDMQFLEFNIPLSAPNGTINRAAPQDRYPIDQDSIIESGIKGKTKVAGDDWAIFKIGRNQLTNESAFDRQGFYRITDDVSIFGNTPLLAVTGYGVDGPPSEYGKKPAPKNCFNRVQQTDKGVFLKEDVSNPPLDNITYKIDTQKANSGSPVYFVGTNMAIAIHDGTVKDKNKVVIANRGTGFKNSELVEAIEKACGTPLQYVDGNYFATVVEGDGSLFKPYVKLEDAMRNSPDQSLIGIVAGHYSGGGISFPKGKKLIFKALGGTVKIGCVY